MKKNGFTLVELLAVIVVLAIVMGIAVYTASYITNKGKEGVYENYEQTLKGAAENYLTDDFAYNNGLNFPEVGTGIDEGKPPKKITYETLYNELFIDNLKDPRGGNCNNSFVLITRDSDVGINFKLDYIVCLICDNYKNFEDQSKDAEYKNKHSVCKDY